MSTPTWNDKVSLVSLQKVANGACVRGTLNVQNLFGAYIFLRVARLTTTAPGTGISVMVRRIMYDSGNTRDVPHPATLALYQDTTAAANLTTLNGSPSHPVAAVTLASATGFAANQQCCIVDSASSPTRAEWQRSSKIASTTLTFDRNMANTNIVTADTITNLALVIPPIWVDGAPNSGDVEVMFDYGAEANSSPVVVEAYAQTLSSVA